jgi:hypothetical protein
MVDTSKRFKFDPAGRRRRARRRTRGGTGGLLDEKSAHSHQKAKFADAFRASKVSIKIRGINKLAIADEPLEKRDVTSLVSRPHFFTTYLSNIY